MEGNFYFLVLLDVHFVVFNEDDGTFVVVLATVVGRAEDGDDTRERLRAPPSVHFVAVQLHLMSSDDRYEVVFLENLLNWVQSEFDRALALRVFAEPHFASLFVVDWVRPQQVTEEARKRRLNMPVDFVDVRLGL